MIWDALVNVLLSILDAVLGILPAFSTPSTGSVADGVEWLGNALASIRPWFNVTLFLSCIALVVGARLAIATARFGVWVYQLIPGKSA